MTIYLLTSSRADYGIYLPLIRKLKSDPAFDLKLVVFGTHLSKRHGYTIAQVWEDGFKVDFQIDTMPEGDSPKLISAATGEIIKKFAEFWELEKEKADIVMCLGDRYEMFAAVAATIPFNLKIAHIHGGETTLGAIDNIYRHSLTLMAKVHFASTTRAAIRIKQLRNSDEEVYQVGALSLDNLTTIEPFQIDEFEDKFGIKLDHPVLVTFHPETVNFASNESHINELISVLSKLKEQVLITMPNADTSNAVIRQRIAEFASSHSNVFAVESLGTRGYFTCLKHCVFVLGNSSSGIIEAASFGKYVINVGSRQAGRESGDNVIHCEIRRAEIQKNINQIKSLPLLSCSNIYGDGKTAERILDILRKQKL